MSKEKTPQDRRVIFRDTLVDELELPRKSPIVIGRRACGRGEDGNPYDFLAFVRSEMPNAWVDKRDFAAPYISQGKLALIMGGIERAPEGIDTYVTKVDTPMEDVPHPERWQFYRVVSKSQGRWAPLNLHVLEQDEIVRFPSLYQATNEVTRLLKERYTDLRRI